MLINSGQANACTGDRGLIDSQGATQALADQLGVEAEAVLICSTGVIGVPIPMPTLLAGLDPLVSALSATGGDAAARAILTTDLVDKQVALEAELGGRRVRIGGMAKGSGMIHPDMATMLAFLSCDAGLESEHWQAMVRRAVNVPSMRSRWMATPAPTTPCWPLRRVRRWLVSTMRPEQGLTEAMQHLARAIARDGEGHLFDRGAG